MEEAKDLGISSVCVSDEPGKFHLIFGSADNVLKAYSGAVNRLKSPKIAG